MGLIPEGFIEVIVDERFPPEFFTVEQLYALADNGAEIVVHGDGPDGTDIHFFTPIDGPEPLLP